MTVPHWVVWCKAEEEGQEEYLLALESSEMANLRADVATAGFVSGAAMSPGRLLRVAHALSRAILMTFSGTEFAALDVRQLAFKEASKQTSM